MNFTIINNYNSVVSDFDTFYFLGDFCFVDEQKEKILIRNKCNGCTTGFGPV